MVVVAALAAGACDKVALTAPTNTTITLFANATSVPLNGVVEVTATVVESAGTPVQNGTQVTFTSNLGAVDPREARTSDGKATVRFTAGTSSGTAKIGAFSGAAKATEIELKVGGATATRIVMSANPSSVPATGGAVEILATVLDADGNRVSGVAVSFSTSAGTLSSQTIITDGNGEARTRLTTTRQATVTATAGAVTAPATLTINVNTAPSVTIAVSPASPTAGSAATFTFTVNSSATNTAALRDLVIDFGDGDKLTLSSPSSTTSISHVYEDGGTYTVTAVATDVNGERSTATTVITVQTPAPLTITLNLQDSAAVNSPVSFRASVTGDTTPSRVVRYEWDFGDGTSAVLNSPATSHIYTTVGRKVVRVTVVTIDGARSTAQEEIFITAS